MLLRLHLSFLAIISGITANADAIRIAVSDVIASHVSETIQTLAKDKAVEISVVSIGSLPAMEYLRSDEISLAVIASPEGSELPDDMFRTFNFAYSTAVVAVGEANPVREVSFDDLRGIFGSDSDLNVDTWGALGIKSLGSRSIKPLIRQNDANISTELFRHRVLQGEAMKLRVNEVIGSEIEEMLLDNVAAVAILPYLPDNEKIKALMISMDSHGPAFGPTNDNVYYGDYPIRLPFRIVYKKDREPALWETLRILLSDEVTEALRESHLFVPPDTIRMSFVRSLSPAE